MTALEEFDLEFGTEQELANLDSGNGPDIPYGEYIVTMDSVSVHASKAGFPTAYFDFKIEEAKDESLIDLSIFFSKSIGGDDPINTKKKLGMFKNFINNFKPTTPFQLTDCTKESDGKLKFSYDTLGEILSDIQMELAERECSFKIKYDKNKNGYEEIYVEEIYEGEA